MPIDRKKIEERLKINFPDANIYLEDTVGDMDHYSLIIESSAFKNIKLIQQHRLVNDALRDFLGKELHALKIKTKPKE